MKITKYFLVTLVVILIDQAVKMLVHFNMDPGLSGEIRIFGNWFKLHYVLNPGMAFGVEVGAGGYGKLLLTTFRLLATLGLGFYIGYLVRQKTHSGFIFCMAMILGGAIGNVVDSVFYGVWLHNSPVGSSTPWFHGQVVDMFYFDIWEGVLPKWVPLWGGEYFSLWPIFNIADASIFIGLALIILFQRKFFGKKKSHSQPLEQSQLS